MEEKNMKLKVVHINIADKNGGAANAVSRINEALFTMGIDSKMLVGYKYSDDTNSISIYNSKMKTIVSKLNPYFDLVFSKFYRKRQRELFSTGLLDNVTFIEKQIDKADIIHLHWINAGILSIKNIYQLSLLRKPIVWTLHDMWAFTGGCHYSNECNKYENKCYRCDTLGSSYKSDLSRIIWNKKEKYFKLIPFQIVTCSNWLSKKAQNSSLLGKKKITVIPNPINTDIYKPIDRKALRGKLGISESERVIMFAGMNAVKDKRKGYRYLHEAMKIIISNSRENIELVVIGSEVDHYKDLTIKKHILGKVYDQNLMASYYNIADVYVLPSIQDNLPNTVMESLACGVPVVAFDVGGVSDMIEHKNNGYLAKYKSIQDLADGINWVLNESEYDKLKKNARESVKRKYSYKIIGEKYKKLYSELMNDKNI